MHFCMNLQSLGYCYLFWILRFSFIAIIVVFADHLTFCLLPGYRFLISFEIVCLCYSLKNWNDNWIHVCSHTDTVMLRTLKSWNELCIGDSWHRSKLLFPENFKGYVHFCTFLTRLTKLAVTWYMPSVWWFRQIGALHFFLFFLSQRSMPTKRTTPAL